MHRFEDSIVLVSGGSSGIGKATALKFAEAGATVIATSKRKTRGEAIHKQLIKFNDQSQWLQADILISSDIEHLFERITENYDRLDIAFNNASAGGSSNILHNFELEDWKKTMDGTLTSVFHFMKKELELMEPQGKGVIVNNSSVDGLRAFPFDPAYAAAKHGVLGLTKSAAVQYAKKGIRINAICPGWVETPPVSRMIEKGYFPKEAMLQHQPIGRLGQPNEIADAVLWLCSPQSSFVTGVSLAVDGGYTII